jgi:redox-sensitive bicupin YhaK (pirin superfamily)
MVDPVYRGIESDTIPVITEENVTIKVISGNYKDISGPAKGLFVNANLMDIQLNPDSELIITSKVAETVLVFIYEGSGSFDSEHLEIISENQLVILNNGSDFYCKSGSNGMSMIFLAGLPLNEPIAWRGPIVMNTSEETQIAFFEYSNGTFIKQKNKFQNMN